MRIFRSKARNISEITINADIPMATHKLTGLGPGTVAGDSVRHEQLAEAAHAASGSYTGDQTANRAIPHGLGATPKIVFIFDSTDGSYNFRIFGALGSIVHWAIGTAFHYAVTIPDATNFYVGYATEWTKSANTTGRVYYWVALA